MKISYYVIKDLADGTYAMGRRFGHTLEQCEARYARTVGAQKDITKMESEGQDVSQVVIVPVYLTAGEAIKPKLRETKTGFVIVVTRRTQFGDGKVRKTVEFWKGNKKKLPETFDQNVATMVRREIEKGYVDPKKGIPDYRMEAFRESAASSGVYAIIGWQNLKANSQVASIFASKEAATGHMEVMRANLSESAKLGKDSNITLSIKAI